MTRPQIFRKIFYFSQYDFPENGSAKILCHWRTRPILWYVFSTPFAPKIVISGDSPGKLFRLFLPLRSTIPENKIILFGILNVYSEK